MVEGNDQNTNEAPSEARTSRRRGGLFGGRRSGRGRASVVTQAADDRDGASVDETSQAATEAATVPSTTAPDSGDDGSATGGTNDSTTDATRDESAAETSALPITGDEPDSAPAQVEDADETSKPEPVSPIPATLTTTSLIFHAPPVLVQTERPERSERADRQPGEADSSSVRRRTRRRSGEEATPADDEPTNTVVKVRAPREPELITEPQRVKGSTRLEAKKQRRRDGRDAGRRRAVITEAEFLARRESVDRQMVVRQKGGRIQIGVLEDGVLVEHYVARNQDASLIGNVYLGRVQNVLPSMEAAFVDIGRGRNAVLYSGEVDWEAAAAEGEKNQPRRIELALKAGDRVLVQVTKDPVGHKGARLTSQVSLPGRYLVYVPNGSMNGISRKLPDTERARLKKILKEVLPENVGVIVRTAAEGATEEQLTLDVNRLTSQWADISAQLEKVQAPALLHSEPDLLVKIVRDVFNEDFQKMIIAGDEARGTIEKYLGAVAPDLLERVERYQGERDAFDAFRITEQIEKALERKVWLPSGGSLVMDRTEAMTVIDVNTGKFVGSGGNLEETVTKNNLEAAEEIVRQLRLRDIGGIIVVDFIDMVLETNRDLVLRRLVECLSRDRTKHQVAEVTSLGLVQMTRKKLGLGLLESFSEACEVCAGRGIIVHHEPIARHRAPQQQVERRRNRGGGGGSAPTHPPADAKAHAGTHAITEDVRRGLAQIAASTIAHADIKAHDADADAVAASSVDATAPSASTTSTDAGTPASRSGRRGRHRRATKEQGAASLQPTESADVTATPTPDASVETVSTSGDTVPTSGDTMPTSGDTVPTSGDDGHTESESVPFIELPSVAPTRERPTLAVEAEVLLDSVLEALPAPKKAGEGRASRSRRVSTAAVSATGDAPVITRADSSADRSAN